MREGLGLTTAYKWPLQTNEVEADYVCEHVQTNWFVATESHCNAKHESVCVHVQTSE